jgi:hypothetical protein
VFGGKVNGDRTPSNLAVRDLSNTARGPGAEGLIRRLWRGLAGHRPMLARWTVQAVSRASGECRRRAR